MATKNTTTKKAAKATTKTAKPATPEVNPTANSATPAKSAEHPEVKQSAEQTGVNARRMTTEAVCALKKGHLLALAVFDSKSKKWQYVGAEMVVFEQKPEPHVGMRIFQISQKRVTEARFNVVDGKLIHTDSGDEYVGIALSDNDRAKVEEFRKNFTKIEKEAKEPKKLPPVGELLAIRYTERALNPGLFIGRVLRHLPDMPGTMVCELANEEFTPQDSMIRLASNEKSGYADESFFQPIAEVIYPLSEELKVRFDALSKMPAFNPPAEETPQQREAKAKPAADEKPAKGAKPEAKAAAKPEKEEKPAAKKAAPAPKKAAKK